MKTRTMFAVLPLILPIVLAAPFAPAAPAPAPADPVWAFEASDVPVDPGYRFGRLANGMRYVIRHNATPAGTAVVRMLVQAGSLDEAEAERGLAHYLEHMAFNGSRHIPEGAMVPLLEREGLAFGADTNASTTFAHTLYKLDLPRADARLVDTALMLMRETAGNLTIAADAVARERGVILAEMRDRDSFALRNAAAAMAFFQPGSLYARRLPIGTQATLDAASAERLRAFYEREYVPGHVALVLVGDIDVDQAEAAIRRRFGDWQAGPVALAAQPDAGPIDPADQDRTAIHIDPALSERITIRRNGAFVDEPDSLANREEGTLRAIGHAIVNRRLDRLAHRADAPFRSARFGTENLFRAGRATALMVSTADGGWQAGLQAVVAEYRRAMAHGFTPAEVAEQVAQMRNALANAVAADATRSNSALAQDALALVEDRIVPMPARAAQDRFALLAPRITPATVMAALLREAVPLDRPLIRFEGRRAPAGGEAALRQTWDAAVQTPVAPPAPVAATAFAYTAFGPAGTVASDTRGPLGIRQIRFANGVMLNLRRTELEQGRIRAHLAIDGGDRLNTPGNPHATRLVANLADGGLGQHSVDDLKTILAGHSVGAGLASGPQSFDAAATTTPRDLELQLQLMAALITEPGYRPAGEARYRQGIDSFFAKRDATPQSALQAQMGSLTSQGDPRFSLASAEEYRALSYARLRADIGDRLAHGAIEIGLAGDLDEAAAIAMVARTFGALPPREAAFHREDQQPPRLFPHLAPGVVTRHVVRHQGPADQAIVRLMWPTRDDRDADEAARLDLLHAIVDLELVAHLREALGKAYSPGSASVMSHTWPGYGYFQIHAAVQPGEVAATQAAIRAVIARLCAAPPSADTLLRARAPMLERLHNALKGNGTWIGLVARAQSEPDRIARFQAAAQRLETITPAQIQATARRWLDARGGMEIVVLPAGAGEGSAAR